MFTAHRRRRQECEPRVIAPELGHPAPSSLADFYTLAYDYTVGAAIVAGLAAPTAAQAPAPPPPAWIGPPTNAPSMAQPYRVLPLLQWIDPGALIAAVSTIDPNNAGAGITAAGWSGGGGAQQQ